MRDEPCIPLAEACPEAQIACIETTTNSPSLRHRHHPTPLCTIASKHQPSLKIHKNVSFKL